MLPGLTRHGPACSLTRATSKSGMRKGGQGGECSGSAHLLAVCRCGGWCGKGGWQQAMVTHSHPSQCQVHLGQKSPMEGDKMTNLLCRHHPQLPLSLTTGPYGSNWAIWFRQDLYSCCHHTPRGFVCLPWCCCSLACAKMLQLLGNDLEAIMQCSKGCKRLASLPVNVLLRLLDSADTRVYCESTVVAAIR